MRKNKKRTNLGTKSSAVTSQSKQTLFLIVIGMGRNYGLHYYSSISDLTVFANYLTQPFHSVSEKSTQAVKPQTSVKPMNCQRAMSMTTFQLVSLRIGIQAFPARVFFRSLIILENLLFALGRTVA